MPQKRYRPEEIIAKLRQAEVLPGQGGREPDGLEEPLHPKVVSERLGHATVAFTLDTYSQAIPAMEEQAAEQIAALVRDA